MLPDELIYSLMGRLVACNAIADPRIYLKLLFGTKNIIPSIDLPTSLASLHERLGVFSPFDSANDIIDAGTIYPYHRPFLTIERHEAVHQILLRGGGKGLKTLLGRVANRFGANPPLRYCAVCIEEDLSRHGVPYWKRMHQLPGVTSCATHGINLVVHLWTSTSPDRQRLLSVPLLPTLRSTRVRSSQRQIWFAELSRDLLHAGLPVLRLQQRQLAYENAVAALGFIPKANHIRHKDLANAVRTYYDDFDGFIHKDRLLSTRLHPLAWLRALVDRPARASHPICHLLLIGFLFRTIEGYQHALHEADHNGVRSCDVRNVSPEISLVSEAEERHDLLLKNVTISCRTIARGLGISVTTVVSRRRAMGIPIAERRKSLTADRLGEIAKALEEGLSPANIARKYMVSLSTVYRVRAQSTDLRNTHQRVREDHEREERRRRWLQAHEDHQNAGIREVRSADQGTYTWLYRHDRAWLQKICKISPSDRTTVPRVDWAARDMELCHRLEELTSDLRLRQDRPRISKTLLLRAAGEAMVLANIERLPRLNAALEKSVESPQAFQMFRIDRAIGQLATQGLPLLLWRIQRLAGIRQWTMALRRHASNIASETAKSLKTGLRP
jgi:DNA-binding CsgD family transcriptional regulator/transposase